MFADSHCHLDFPELRTQLSNVHAAMVQAGVTRALCISVRLETVPDVLAVAETHQGWHATVGVHPDYQDIEEPSVARLVAEAAHAKVVAIGETGLDYYRLGGDLEWQRERFRTHIRAARQVRKPLVIHTRSAAEDTLRLLDEEGAEDVGGVLHCFTETQAVADAALERGFYLSFSGIVTFRNAKALKEVARQIPLDRLLIETDSPYLAPEPMRGKANQPAYVLHVAGEIARLRGISIEEVGERTTENYCRLFRVC
ncbi:TatD family hydrolase [Ferrovum sp.]|uniref:TatD family hydrolase n=1 Tax=Ferrovum sp. TaxID=2609467 RepID=UPI00262FF8D1|nr:TatD family hydrolase [Ferrovum sp.]